MNVIDCCFIFRALDLMILQVEVLLVFLALPCKVSFRHFINLHKSIFLKEISPLKYFQCLNRLILKQHSVMFVLLHIVLAFFLPFLITRTEDCRCALWLPWSSGELQLSRKSEEASLKVIIIASSKKRFPNEFLLLYACIMEVTCILVE